MGKYLLRRLVLLVPTLLGISALVLVLMRLLPGNAVDVLIGTEITLGPEQRKTLMRLFGLDTPIYLHYLRWLGEVLRGNLGVSLRTSEPMTRVLMQRLPITAELAILSVCLSWVLAIPLGVVSAVRRGGALDFFSHIVGLLGLSVPSGLRRDEAASRAGSPIVTRDLRGLIKVNPLATWTSADVADYIATHDVPVNPLTTRGYPSIGCMPCTHPVAPGEDPRSGRWVGRDKSECGLHLD